KKLKAFQLEQSQSSRKAQIKREHSLKSLAKSLSVWLNFLLQNPTSCGCHLSASNVAPALATNGKSYWKGYLARKEPKEQLLDLRLRMQKSARNVDDSKRLINRLLAALSELLNMKSLSNILHTCSTLDMATGHSQKCCEELVAAGAIDTLLQLIQTISRSIPDQEVLKHALSTLRNLARYPHLLQVLIQSRSSVQIIVLELLRNKNEGYFVASELLKKICSTRIGIERIFKSPALLKRLHGLVEDLTRKGIYEKRNPRAPSLAIRKDRERRLKEAAEILKLITTPDFFSSSSDVKL
ncbi:Abnormal spindle-like microcephaly-associated protein like, partial [Glycine soja]